MTTRGDNLSAQRLILDKVGSLSIFTVISLSEGLLVALVVFSSGGGGIGGAGGGGGGGGGTAGVLRTVEGIVTGREIKEALLLFLGTIL